MSNAHTRDMEELEGALLPVATEVVGNYNGDSNVTSAAVAYPFTATVSGYDDALDNEQGLARGGNFEAIVVPNNGDQPNYAGVSDDSRATIKRAERIGKIRSEEERESIRRANQKIHSQNEFHRDSIRRANQRAKERDREGLDTKIDHIAEQMAQSAKVKAENAKKQQQEEQEQKTTGYHVKEYECGTYETKAYEVAEYNSIYD
mmetsp:Transcript_4798/g.12317  ORF Transcript_4798/g.12317 Transcript_4798/m.12317 type:complete len:204 (-) Transcript_4798:2019-2630(-)